MSLTIILLLLGITGVLASLFIAKRLDRPKTPPTTWRAVQGTIVDCKEWEAQVDPNRIPVARVQFTYEVKGTVYRREQSWAYGMEAPQRGNPITVYYEPTHPQRKI